MKRAIFLDRDGVLNENTGYIHQPDDLKILPGVIPALQRMRSLGYKLYVISNQGGIGRGHMTHEELTAITLRFRELVYPTAPLDGIYYCVHAPEAQCACRKPSPGLLYKVACDEEIDLSRSFFIGDMATDILAGTRAGVKTILVMTGQAHDQIAAMLLDREPDYVAIDLPDAVDWIERCPWDECQSRVTPGTSSPTSIS